MDIILAGTAGFCFGVNRAIRMVEDCLDNNKGKRIYSHGQVIHNKQVIEDLQGKGLKVIEDIDRVDEGILIIRAHGISPAIYEQIKKKNVEAVDTTCPFVKKIHIKVKERSCEGCKIVIAGDRNHPEVIGIMGWDKDAVVVGSEQEAQELELSGKVCVVAQTTLSKEKWDDICGIIKQKVNDAEFCNTICSATSERQKEAREIAGKVDAMIVIGDPGSSNTRKLYEISRKYCENTFLIENKEQLEKILETEKVFLYRTQDGRLGTDIKVGVTAGASTPDRIIKEVIGRMSEENKQVEEMSFEELFENSMRVIHDGEVVKGKIIGVTGKEIFVDLGYKADGIIPLEELSDAPEEKLLDKYKAGDEIEVYILKVNDGEGNALIISKDGTRFPKPLNQVR